MTAIQDRSALAPPAAERVRTVRVRPADYSGLDYALYTAQDSYRCPPARTEVLEWLAGALEHQLAHSPAYARLAQARGFTLADFAASGDVGSIPLVSSGSFKRGSVATHAGGPVRLCTSSGTLGSKSVVPRDHRTLERFIGTVLHGMRHFLVQTELRRGFVLGPPREQAGDLWFAYALSLAEVLHDADYFVTDGRFRPEALFEALSNVEDGVQPFIVTPPSLLLVFLRWMEEQRAALDLSGSSAVILTAGGWKRNTSEAVDRDELQLRAAELLSVGASEFRDVFNMVELNSLIFECRHARKHIPPWLHVDARSSTNLVPLPAGEVGLLAYLDPTPLSYPGFVLSDDLGTVTNEQCPCGIDGAVLRLARRLTSIEERGCGLKMNRYDQENSDT